MRRLLAVLATTAVALTAGPGVATAEDLRVVGERCHYTAVSDPASPGLTAEVDGGPITVVGAGPAPTVELVCTFQLDAWTHDGADAATVSASGPGVAVVTPTLVSLDLDWDQDVVLCSELRVTTATGVRALYWDDFDDRWADTPDVGCMNLLPDQSGPDLQPIFEQLDLVVCPVLATLFPPEGDVTVPVVLGKVWDCPPYDV